MSAPGALAVTGVVLLFAAVCCAIAADDQPIRSDQRRRLALTGWLLFAAAVLAGIGAPWWEALS